MGTRNILHMRYNILSINSFVGHMFFHCYEIHLHWFFTVNSPVIFPKYIFEFLFNYESLNEILLTSIGSVVERRTRARTKMRGSNPTDFPFSSFLFCFACLFCFFICNFFPVGFFLFLPTTGP